MIFTILSSLDLPPMTYVLRLFLTFPWILSNSVVFFMIEEFYFLHLLQYLPNATLFFLISGLNLKHLMKLWFEKRKRIRQSLFCDSFLNFYHFKCKYLICLPLGLELIIFYAIRYASYLSVPHCDCYALYVCMQCCLQDVFCVSRDVWSLKRQNLRTLYWTNLH